MNATLSLTLVGNIVIHNDDEDAPLIKVNFENEARGLSEDARARIGRVVFDEYFEVLHNKGIKSKWDQMAEDHGASLD